MKQLTPEEAVAELARVKALLDASPTVIHDTMTVSAGPERDPICAHGCYMFRDGPEREQCRAACRILATRRSP